MTIEKINVDKLEAEEVEDVSGLTDGTLPPLVCGIKNGRYVVYDGCHRLAGMIKAGESAVTCLVGSLDEYRAFKSWEAVVESLGYNF